MSSPHDNLSNEVNESDDVDAILAELEAEEEKDLSSLRGQRAADMLSMRSGKATTSIKQAKYITLTSDDDTLRYTTEYEKVILHFFHPEFARCSIMDEHLTLIAQRHADYGTDAAEGEVVFARVDVKHAEFVVQKLGIKILPCVIGFVKGSIKGRIIGFEGVSWGGQEKGITVTSAVEERFVDWRILRRGLVGQQDDDASDNDEDNSARNGRRGISGRKQIIEDEDDDWD